MPNSAKSKFPNFHTIHHPLVQHKLSLLRDANTSQKVFRELLYEITLLLAFPATQNLAVKDTTVETPITKITTQILQDQEILLVPILRAGLGMLDAMLTLMPNAKVGHIGLYRDEETRAAHRYYLRIPPIRTTTQCIVCDPMLATGNTSITAISQLIEAGAKEISFICVLAAPEGVKQIHEKYPQIRIYGASLDERLNESSFIVPGLGDAGDRLFGTER